MTVHEYKEFNVLASALMECLFRQYTPPAVSAGVDYVMAAPNQGD